MTTLWKKLSIMLCCLAACLLLPACGSDDDGGDPGGTITDPGIEMEDALTDYWEAQDGMTGALSDMGNTWDQIEAGLSSKTATPEAITELVDQFLAQSVAAGERFDTLIEYEDAIIPYGADKGMFTDAAKAVVVGVLNAGKKVVVSSGQMVRTGWRVLSGNYTLRDALRAPDSGIPIVSDMARRLGEHNAQRDAAIEQSILDGNNQDGFIPIDELQGGTPEERAQYYRNLPDDSQLKMVTRGQVHAWHDGERDATVVTLKKAAQDQIKNYAGAVGGSEVLVEVGDQMVNPDQPTDQRGTVRPTLRDAETEAPPTGDAIMIVSKRNQPEDQAKIAVLEDIDPEFDLELPEGEYDVVLISEEYIRGVQGEIEIAEQVIEDIFFDLLALANNSLIVESLTANPEVAGVNEEVVMLATVVSTIGQTPSFEWSAAGPGTATVTGTGPRAVFQADTAGDYIVTLTATDPLGNQKTDTEEIQVIDGDVEITEVTVGDGAFVDGELNPGEQVSLTLAVTCTADMAVTGTATVTGEDGALLVGSATQAMTLEAGATSTWPLTIKLPGDWSRDMASYTFTFETDEAIITQMIELPVSFYVEINPVSSPVTNRVLRVTGKVANPMLDSAWLALAGDVDQVFEVNLSNGQFSQDIALEGDDEEQDLSLWLVADSGTWREEDTEEFTAEIDPAGFRVTMSWDTNGTDVDLWVTDPDGVKCYFGNRTTASGLALDFDDTDGYGPENITNISPPAGGYLVQAHYYSDHDTETAIGTSVQITIRLNEGTDDEEISSYSGYLSDTGDIWTVTTMQITEDKSSCSFQDDGSHSYLSPQELEPK